jgi:hypothetical protein
MNSLPVPGLSEPIQIVLLALLLIVELFWLISVVHIAQTKTKDPFDRIVWLMVVLALNAIGTLLYLIFAPDKPKRQSRTYFVPDQSEMSTDKDALNPEE